MFMVILRSGILTSFIFRFFYGLQPARERVPDGGGGAAMTVGICPVLRRAKPEKGEQIIFRSEPKAALVPRWPWAIISSSLQDFFARIVEEQVIKQVCTTTLWAVISDHSGVFSVPSRQQI